MVIIIECARIHYLKLGMSSVNVRVMLSEILRPKQVITSKGVEHESLKQKVADQISAMTLVLWAEKILPLKVGDVLQIRNGFVMPFKGELRIDVGKYGETAKILVHACN